MTVRDSPRTFETPGAETAAGIVVALCKGHRCAALVKAPGDGDLAAAVSRSSGGILITAPCLQQCAEGAVAAVAVRPHRGAVTGPSLWLGGLETADRLRVLGRWVEEWTPGDGQEPALPEDLRCAVLGVGAPVRFGPTMPH